MAPFREMLCAKDRKLYRDPTMNEFFEESKQNIVHMIEKGMETFGMDRATCLSPDLVRPALGTSFFKNTVDAQQNPVLNAVRTTGK